jgi:HEPN domain-containing protein
MNRGTDQARLYLRKAASDERLLDAVLTDTTVGDDVFGFHCQQAAEKLLKALLSELRVSFRHTHDLTELMDQLADAGAALPKQFDQLKTLSAYAVEFRYEDVPTGAPLERSAARQMIRELRQFVESKLSLAPP